MKAIALAFVLILTVGASAQTTAPKVADQTPLAQCQADLKDYKDAQGATIQLMANNAQLETTIKRLEARNAELQERYAQLAKLSNEVLDSNARLVAEYEKLRAENTAFSTRGEDRSAIEVNRELARAIRINSALALANSFKVAPVQVTMPNLNRAPLNCTSNAIGSTTYTNCQ
jgi:septal ring factor EnvC (AmiA/AmiB activator)